MASVRTQRDIAIFEKIAGMERQKVAPEEIVRLKQALITAGYHFDSLTRGDAEEKQEENEANKPECGYSVCSFFVCVASTTCDNGACADGGCSSMVDYCGFRSNSNPCEGGNATCTDHACQNHAGQGPNPILCKNGNVCSQKSVVKPKKPKKG